MFADFILFKILSAIGIKNIIMFFSALLLFLLFEKLIVKPFVEIPIEKNLRKTPKENRVNTEYYYEKALRKIIKKKCSRRILEGKSLQDGYIWYSPKGNIAIKGIFNEGGMLRPLYVSPFDFKIASLNGIGKEPVENPFEMRSKETKENDYNIIITNNYVIYDYDYSKCTYNSSFIHLFGNTFILTNGEIGLKEFAEFYDGLEKTNKPIMLSYKIIDGRFRLKEVARK